MFCSKQQVEPVRSVIKSYSGRAYEAQNEAPIENHPCVIKYVSIVQPSSTVTRGEPGSGGVPKPLSFEREIVRDSRLGGMLNYYRRAA